MTNSYYPTIGIECHVQLKTKTKLFAAVGNDARQAEPNTLISHICVGMPGALPVLNRSAVELAVRASYAFGVRPQKFSKFDRKHYFYPDLPKGYQISQYDRPIVAGGQVDFQVDNEPKSVRITRAHLEEDAGKNTHPDGADYSLVDLNRAGTPLLEIVSEPDIHSPAEAKAYARELYLLMKYAGVSDCDLYHGNMRFDVNVSLSKDRKKLGTRSEVKNLNSFKSVESAVAYEIKRQTEILEKGGEIIQETRGWDEAKQKTISQRGKEEAHDYRYMPEPDVPPIVLDDDYAEEIHKNMPTLPHEWRKRLQSAGIDKDTIETVLETEVEFEDRSFLPLIEDSFSDPEKVKFLLNWLVNVSWPLIREGSFKPTNNNLSLELTIYELIKQGNINSTSAKTLYTELARMETLPEDIAGYAKEHSYIQISDEQAIESIIKAVLDENPQAVKDIEQGELKAIGYLVGQVMSRSKGQANPALAQKLIKKQLDIEK